MTALQDWLSLKPIDHLAIRQMVIGPLRSVLSLPEQPAMPAPRLLTPGVERC